MALTIQNNLTASITTINMQTVGYKVNRNLKQVSQEHAAALEAFSFKKEAVSMIFGATSAILTGKTIGEVDLSFQKIKEASFNHGGKDNSLIKFSSQRHSLYASAEVISNNRSSEYTDSFGNKSFF